MTQPIAVFGASGAQGSPVAHALLEAGQPVRAIARTEAHLKDLAAHGAEVFALDLTDTANLRLALTGVAGAFVHFPFITMLETAEAQAHSVATALRDAQVPLTVLTLSGPVPTSSTGVMSFDAKAAISRIMQASGVPLITFQPVGYLGNISAPFGAPAIVKHNELRYSLPAEHRQPWISVEDQAKLAITALNRPDLAGRTFRIGEQLSGPELAAAISDGLGRTIRYVPLTPKQMWTPFAPFIGQGFVDALVHDYSALASNSAALALHTDSQAVRRELGLAATPVAEWAKTQNWEAAANVFPI